jgi:hypothetical protein
MWPVLYIRATENTPDHDDNLYKPIVTPRASNFSEVDKYKKKFASLSESVKSLLNSSHFKLTSTSDADNFFPGEMDDWGQVLNEWPEYEDGMGDYLNTRDAVYGNPGEEQELAPKGVAAMIGVKHTKLNMTVFNNAGISSLADTYLGIRQMDRRCRDGEVWYFQQQQRLRGPLGRIFQEGGFLLQVPFGILLLYHLRR